MKDITPGTNKLKEDCFVDYYPDFLGEDQADAILALAKSLPCQQNPLWVRRSVLEPHLACWVADAGVNLRYSGAVMEPHPECWTDDLRQLHRKVEAVAGCNYQGILFNNYRDGTDSIGWHRDKKSAMGESVVIPSVSLGISRLFELGVKAGSGYEPRFAVRPVHGSLLVMRGNTNKEFYHRVEPDTAVSEQRFNLTFRMTPKRSKTLAASACR